MKKIALHWQVLIALGLALIVGILVRYFESRGIRIAIFGVTAIGAFDFVGTLFLNALKMLIVPLVASSIISGITGIGNVDGFGRLGLKTMGYYLLTSFLAIVLGLVLVNLIGPGKGGEQSELLKSSATVTQETLSQVEDRGAEDVAKVFLRLIPPNVVRAAADGQLLGLIFFSLLFGYFMTRLKNDPIRETAVNVWQGIYEIMLKITDLIMSFAPIGVFALVANVFATTGFDVFGDVLMFFVTVMLALGIHTFVTLPLLLILLGRVRPWRHYEAMFPAILTAFSTASSSATLPLSMECVEKRAGVSNRVTSFVLPLGATINMDGTALYECVAAMFIAQALGIELSFAQQFTVVLLALLTSIGVAGIPQASLVAILVIMKSVGLPEEAIGLLFATDRILDMCRTSVNIFSDSCGAVVIGRSEGEKEILLASAPLGPQRVD
jgi:proton glutamate symport protein